MCSCEDGEAPRVFETRLRSSRREHRCCECARPIPHGAWYEDANGLWDDRWDSFSTCLRCAARRNAWAAIECAPAFKQLRETIECMTRRVWRGRDANGRSIYARHIDRKAGRQYLAALRAARSALQGQVAKLEAERAARYSQAGKRREALKRQRAHLGEGI